MTTGDSKLDIQCQLLVGIHKNSLWNISLTFSEISDAAVQDCLKYSTVRQLHKQLSPKELQGCNCKMR